MALTIQPKSVASSQNPLGWKGPFKIILFNPPSAAGSTPAGWQGPCPVGFWICPQMDTQQSLWATWNFETHGLRSLFFSPEGISCYLCPLSLALPLKYLYTLIRASWIFSSPGWNNLNSFSLSYRRCFSPLIIFAAQVGLSPVSPYLSCTGGLRTGHSPSDAASPVQRREEGAPFWTCYQCSSQCIFTEYTTQNTSTFNSVINPL